MPPAGLVDNNSSRVRLPTFRSKDSTLQDYGSEGASPMKEGEISMSDFSKKEGRAPAGGRDDEKCTSNKLQPPPPRSPPSSKNGIVDNAYTPTSQVTAKKEEEEEEEESSTIQNQQYASSSFLLPLRGGDDVHLKRSLTEHHQERQQRQLLALETEHIVARRRHEHLAALQERHRHLVELSASTSMYYRHQSLASSATLLQRELELARRQQQAILAASTTVGSAQHLPTLGGILGPSYFQQPHLLAPLSLQVPNLASVRETGDASSNILPTTMAGAPTGILFASRIDPASRYGRGSSAQNLLLLRGHTAMRGQDNLTSVSSDTQESTREGGGSRFPSTLLRQSHVDTTKRLLERYSSGGTKEAPFPLKLHAILADPAHEDMIVWLPSGKSWRVLNPLAFEAHVIPRFFRHTKYASFMRQVNGWGFKRNLQGVEHNSYFHNLFVRGKPELSLKMKRLGATRNAAGEPVLDPGGDERRKSPVTATRAKAS